MRDIQKKNLGWEAARSCGFFGKAHRLVLFLGVAIENIDKMFGKNRLLLGRDQQKWLGVLNLGKQWLRGYMVKAFKMKQQRSGELTDRILTLMLEHFLELFLLNIILLFHILLNIILLFQSQFSLFCPPPPNPPPPHSHPCFLCP